MSKGYYYIATGTHFLKEAIHSLNSLKTNTNLPTAVATDTVNIALAEKYFDHVVEVKNPEFNFIDKISPLIESPFDFTIFVDTDTYIVEDISNLFDLLECYDLAACHAPGRQQMKVAEIPDFFPEFNTGLIVYKKSELCRAMIKNWLHIYKLQVKNGDNPPHDQPAFRLALYESKLQVYCLPNEFNFRITNPNIIWGDASVKLIHGRHKDFADLASYCNEDPKNIKVIFHDIRYLVKVPFKFIKLDQNRYWSVKFLNKVGMTFMKLEEIIRRRKPVTKIKGN